MASVYLVNTTEDCGTNMRQVAALLKAKPRESEVTLAKTSVSGFITHHHWLSLSHSQHAVVHVYKSKTDEANIKIKVYRNDK